MWPITEPPGRRTESLSRLASAFLRELSSVRMAIACVSPSVRSDLQYNQIESPKVGVAVGGGPRDAAPSELRLQFQSVPSPEDAHSEGACSQPSRRADAADARAVALAWLGLG